jgi:putative nucleotidyltransferase-like protein
MWERIDSLLAATGSSTDVLRVQRVELLEARRRRAAGLELGADLIADETRAAVNELATPGLLARVRAAWDGPLVLMKGPEVALDYGATGLRSYGDLDFLTDDAEAAQAALIAAGFQEVFEAWIYEDIHHLRPLWWPGLPLVIELHSRANWPARIPGPPTEELLAAAVPSRIGIDGIDALPPEHHTLLLAAHAWEHQPLGRLGNLIDVAVSLRRSDEAEVARLARRWGCTRMWRTTRAAVRAVVEGGRGSVAVALWARHLPAIRERTVLEWHVKNLLAPAWGYPRRRVPGAALAQLRAVRLSRAPRALRNAGVARSDHNLAITEEAG